MSETIEQKCLSKGVKLTDQRRIIAKVMSELSAGQAKEFTGEPILDWKSYDTLVSSKTVPLLSAAVEGPILLSNKTEYFETIRNFIHSLGLGYQISNDISDALGRDGSNNPVGIDSSVDKIPFYPYFYFKDLFSVLVFITFFSVFVFYYPNSLGHPDNYIPANPMVTPAHIVPEWYFLPFYAILRSIPDKLGGVLAMGGALIMLLLLPWLNTSKVRSTAFRPIYRKIYWMCRFYNITTLVSSVNFTMI